MFAANLRGTRHAHPAGFDLIAFGCTRLELFALFVSFRGSLPSLSLELFQKLFYSFMLVENIGIRGRGGGGVRNFFVENVDYEGRRGEKSVERKVTYNLNVHNYWINNWNVCTCVYVCVYM